MVKTFYFFNGQYHLRADENDTSLTCGQLLSQLSDFREDSLVIITSRFNSDKKYMYPEFKRGVQIIKVSEDGVFILSKDIQKMNDCFNFHPLTVGEIMNELIKLKGCESLPVIILDDTSKTADFVYSVEGKLFRDRKRRQDHEIAVIFESTM